MNSTFHGSLLRKQVTTYTPSVEVLSNSVLELERKRKHISATYYLFKSNVVLQTLLLTLND